MRKKKIAFLFGAGAEAKGNFNLKSGIDFMRDSYLNKDLYTKQTKYLKTIFDKSYFVKDKDESDTSYKYSSYNYADDNTIKSIMKKWIFNQFFNQDISEKYKHQLYSVLSKEDFKDLFEKDYDNNLYIQMDKKNSSEDYFLMFKNLLLSSRFDEIDLKEINDTFLESFIDGLEFKKDLPTGISFILDRHFHTIIDPQRFGINNFSKVFNYYWAIFIAIYLPVIGLIKDDYPNNELEASDDLEYKPALDNLSDNIDKLYNNSKVWSKIKKQAKSTYYQYIEEVFNDKDSQVKVSGVITSNYYKFIEIVNTEPKNSYAYLNGQLKLFEIPETLEVIDVTKEPLPKDNLYFLFIFGQSYIKPIVSNYQIEAFSTMKDILNNSDFLVVLGYNINEDDNHINSFIRSFVKINDNYLIIVSNNSNKAEIKSKLKLNNCDNLLILKVNYADGNEIIVNQIKDLVNSLLH